VTSAWEAVDGRRRRVYHLSRAGRREAVVAARDWKQFAAAVDHVLGAIA